MNNTHLESVPAPPQKHIPMQSVEIRTAIRTSICVVLVALIAFSLHLPSPYWSCMTVIIISRLYHGEIIAKGFMRVIGTFIGAFLGFFLSAFIANSFYLFIIINFFVISIGFYGYRRSRYPYAFLLAMITIFLICSEIITNPDNAFFIAIWRPIEISLGVIVASLGALFILPNKGLTRLNDLLNDHSRQLQQLTQNIYDRSVKNNDLTTDMRKNMVEIRQLLTALSFEVDETTLTIVQKKVDMHQQLMINLLTLDEAYHPKEKKISLLIRLKIPFAIKELSKQLNHPVTTINNEFFDKLLTSINKQYLTLRHTDKLKIYDIAAIKQFHHVYKILKSINALFQAHSPANYLPKIKRIDADPDAIKQSIKAGLTGMLSLFLWILSDWPSGIQGIISSLILSIQRNVEDMNTIGIQRFCGCLIGGACALLLMRFTYLDLSLLIGSLLLFCGIFHYFYFKLKNNNTIFLQANIAFVITIVQVGGPPTSLAPPLERLAGILIGIFSSVIIANLFWRHTLQSYTIDRIAKLYQLVINNLLLSNKLDTTLHNLSPLITLIRGYFNKLPNNVKNKNYQLLFDHLISIQRLIKLNSLHLSHIIVEAADFLTLNVQTYQQQLTILLQQNQTKPIDYLTDNRRLDLSHAINKSLTELRTNPKRRQLSSQQVNELISYLTSIDKCLTLNK